MTTNVDPRAVRVKASSSTFHYEQFYERQLNKRHMKTTIAMEVGLPLYYLTMGDKLKKINLDEIAM